MFERLSAYTSVDVSIVELLKGPAATERAAAAPAERMMWAKPKTRLISEEAIS